MLQTASENVKTKWEIFSLAAGPWEAEELFCLDIILAHQSNYIGETRETVMHKLHVGRWQAWVVEGKRGKILLLTQINNYMTGNELYIVGLAGKGLCFHFKQVLAQVEVIMKHFNCRFLQCHTASEKMAKLLRKHRFTPIAQNFLRVRRDD